MLLSLHIRSSQEVYWKQMKLRSPNITENKIWESLKWKVWEFGNEGLMRVWWNRRNESEEREWEKRNEKNKMRVCSNFEFFGNSV